MVKMRAYGITTVLDIFEKISVLNSYFIHRYIIINYRSSSILDKIRQLLWELWLCKMLVSG